MSCFPGLKCFFLAAWVFLIMPQWVVAEPVCQAKAPVWSLELGTVRDHDPQSYTQGLFIWDGGLYESAGLYGQSKVTRKTFTPQGQPQLQRQYILAPKYFAEGATRVGADIYLITWEENTGFILDGDTLTVKNQFSYPGQGWGLAWDGQKLWRSDGTNLLYPHQPGNFASAGQPISVTDGGNPVDKLNELEWDPLTGLLLANIYGEDRVAAIDLARGRVVFWLDGSPLRPLAEARGLPVGKSWDTVLNGLALEEGSLWLTGKLWPAIFEATWPPPEWQSFARSGPRSEASGGKAKPAGELL